MSITTTVSWQYAKIQDMVDFHGTATDCDGQQVIARVPGVGDGAIARLAAVDVKTPLQLFGYFLACGSIEEFNDWCLDVVGINPSHQQKITDAMVFRAEQLFG
jgi:hypothetical protein